MLWSPETLPSFFLAIAVHVYLKVQKRTQVKLNAVIGPNHYILNITDQLKLPYINTMT